MARTAQGRGVHAVPILTRGLSDRVWVQSGEARRVDGCYFQVVGSVEKAKGVRNLVDWSKREFHLINTRISALRSFRPLGGPEELVVSLAGDSSVAGDFYPWIQSDGGASAEIAKRQYRGGRVLLVRGDRLEHVYLPHIATDSAWDHSLSGGAGSKGVGFIAARRSEPLDQYDGDYFAEWSGWLYISNGVDANIKWNGSYAARVGVLETPSEPKAQLISSTRMALDYSFSCEARGVGGPERRNTTPQQRFQYRATFVNEVGAEGPPGAPGGFVLSDQGLSSAVQTDAGVWVGSEGSSIEISDHPRRGIVKITGLSRPSQSDLVWRNIYKRAADGEYYFWRQVAVNEQVVYDHENVLSSASLGTPLNEAAQAPPTAKFIRFFRGRGYYVSKSLPSMIQYSDPGIPEQISSGLQFLDVNSGDGEPITGLVSFADSLVVLKPNSIWQITALADGSPALTPVDESIGSVAPRAAILAYERLVFVGEHGVYQYDGATIRPLSQNLNRWWRGVSKSRLRTAFSWLDEAERRLFIAIQSGPDSLNDTVVCYHYQLDAVTVVKGQRATAATIFGGEQVLATSLPPIAAQVDKVRVSPTPDDKLEGSKKSAGLVSEVRNADIVIWGLGDSMSYEYAPGTDPGLKDPPTVEAGSIAGKVRFGPYSANQTGWESGAEMEVAGLDLFFPYAGDHTLTMRWYKNRDPVAAGSMSITLNQEGSRMQKAANSDITSKSGWDASGKTWGTSTWSGDQQLFQRIAFPNTLVCREIEIEFENSNDGEPYLLDGFVLWRTSKGAERQR